MFGSGRVIASHGDDRDAARWSESFGRAMAFKNDYLLRPARAIVARLGGQKNFLGAHLRVGDGAFLSHARQNSEQSWRRLVGEKLGVRAEVLEEMWERVKSEESEEVVQSRAGSRWRKEKRSTPHHLHQRSPWALVDGEYDPTLDSSATSSSVTKRGLLDSAVSWLSGPEPSTLLRNLTCRAPLHTSRRFRAFNTPLYIATDSRSPETDVNLRPFFDAFPCTFILNDFVKPDESRNDGLVVRSVDEMGRLVNKMDGVPLGRLFLPFLEAVVAAMAKEVVGTHGSTFSGSSSFSSSSVSTKLTDLPLLPVCRIRRSASSSGVLGWAVADFGVVRARSSDVKEED
jgi:hypothetical protein